MKQLVIIGASGHGKVVADIARRTGYDNIVFLDDNEALTECSGYAVVGRSAEFERFDCDIFVAIGSPKVRQMLQERLLSCGKSVPVLVHPGAVIGENVSIGAGTVVVAGAVINPCTVIGKGCIINTGSSVDHDCRIGDYVHISVGTHVAGTVEIGQRTWVGAGATVSNNVFICADCMIGAGAVVVKNISEAGTYKGVPAMKSAKKIGGGGSTL